jgi:hypothetical protein
VSDIEWSKFEKLDGHIQRRIAIHEAAHAVAGWHLGAGDSYIEKTDDNRDSWAHAVTACRWGDWEALAVVSIAGQVAQSIDDPLADYTLDPRVNGIDDTEGFEFPFPPNGVGDWLIEWEEAGPDPDFDNAVMHLSCLCHFDPDDSAHYPERATALEWLALHTHRLLSEWWEDVESVVAAFLRAGGSVNAEQMKEPLSPGLSTSHGVVGRSPLSTRSGPGWSHDHDDPNVR